MYQINKYSLNYVKFRASYLAVTLEGKTVNKEILRTVLYVLMGVLQTISIILQSFPDDKQAQDIVTVLKSLITLIQDALDNGAMWEE